MTELTCNTAAQLLTLYRLLGHRYLRFRAANTSSNNQGIQLYVP